MLHCLAFLSKGLVHVPLKTYSRASFLPHPPLLEDRVKLRNSLLIVELPQNSSLLAKGSAVKSNKYEIKVTKNIRTRSSQPRAYPLDRIRPRSEPGAPFSLIIISSDNGSLHVHTWEIGLLIG